MLRRRIARRLVLFVLSDYIMKYRICCFIAWHIVVQLFRVTSPALKVGRVSILFKSKMEYQRTTEEQGNRIFLWVNPRSLSTVFTKCVGLMEGSCVWFEPYTTCMFLGMLSNSELKEKYPRIAYLQSEVAETVKTLETGDHHFVGGNLKPLSMFCYDWVQEELSKPLPSGKKFLFVKEGSRAIIDRYEILPKALFKHTFLIRDPLRAAESNRKLSMTLYGPDCDYDMYQVDPTFDRKNPPNPCHDLWKYVKENIDPNPVVIDADDLQTFPEQILRKYCEAVNIPFKTKYLQWEESDQSIKYFNGCLGQLVLGKRLQFYETALTSSHFKPIKSSKPNFEDLTPDCQKYVMENQEGYKEMFESRIKPDQC